MTDPSAPPLPPADPAGQLLERWLQGERPDVAAFLAEAGPLSPAKLAAVLRVDQRQRWRAGERVPAEDYLRRHPEVRADAEAAVDLVYGEYLLRERLGEPVGIDEYARRFPEHAGVLRAQAELHRAVQAETPAPAGPAPGQTTLYEAEGGPALAPERITLARVGGRGPLTGEEVQTLLRRRLLFVAGVSCVVFVVYALASRRRFFDPVTLSLYALMLALAGGLAGLLWSRRPLSPRQLRWVEGVLFAGLAVFFTRVHCLIFAGGWPSRVAEDDRPALMMVARALSFNWFSLLIGYGLLIPNTARRCAAFVGVMALWPVLLNLALARWYLPPEAGRAFLVESALNMAFAAALAVYGAHRIEVLREQALEARKVGQYRLGRRLGAGGMGEVYLAEHLLLRRPCAVKLIRPERAGDPRDLARFEREVQATAALTHPNTVQVYDYGRADDGTFYYAMEYLPGLDLDELVRRHGALPPGRAVHLLRQVLGALAEAHAAGLVHRDIKPGNVIVGTRGGVHDVAKLLDFGLVRAVALPAGDDRLTQDGAIAGTPAYLSPEQASGLQNPDGRSDIYSLGALAYFLLAGRPPFAARSAVQVLAAHLYEAPAPLGELRPDVPADLEAVVQRCLAKDPAERFADVAALDRALAGCAAAAAWTEEQAAAWWRARGGPEA